MAIIEEYISGKLSADNILQDADFSPLFINDLDTDTESTDAFLDYVRTEVDDSLSVRPTCYCGDLADYSSLGLSTATCTNCGEPVRRRYSAVLKPIVFLRSPKEIDTLILPIFWAQLKEAFTTKRVFNPIMYLSNPLYKEYDEVVVNALTAGGFVKRDYNTLCANLEDIIALLSALPVFKNRPSVKTLLDTFQLNRDDIFVDSIYFPNKSLFIIENTSYGKFMDGNFGGLLDGMLMVLGIDKKDTVNARKRGIIISSVINKLALFWDSYFRKVFTGKYGSIRGHIYSVRAITAARLVTISRTDPHGHDKIRFPWPAAVMTFRVHLLSMLIKKGYTVFAAQGLLNTHVYVYNEVINELFVELLAQNKEQVIKTIMQRFPSLHSGNMLKMGIDEIKTDPKDLAADNPINITAFHNGDFDGDMDHYNIILDDNTSELYEPLSPAHCLTDPTAVKKFNNRLILSVPVVACLSSWLERNTQDEATLEQTNTMYEMLS